MLREILEINTTISESRSINEKNIKYKKAVNTLNLMELGAIPMNPKILKNHTTNIKKAYHITDVKGLEKLYKIQNKKTKSLYSQMVVMEWFITNF